MTFKPRKLGRRTGSLLIGFNGPGEQVPLHGFGVAR